MEKGKELLVLSKLWQSLGHVAMCSEEEMRFEMLGGKASKGLLPWAHEGCSTLERLRPGVL